MTRILGFDPGTMRTGWAILDDDKLDSSGVFELRGDSLDERLQDLWRLLHTLVSPFDLVGVEMPPGHVKGHRRDVGLKIGMSIGIIKAFAFSRRIPMLSVHHATCKKILTGNGRASKAEVQEAVKADFGLHEVAEDEADAVAVAVASRELWWKVVKR